MAGWHEEDRDQDDDRGMLDAEQMAECARAYDDPQRSPVPTLTRYGWIRA